ncbi:hypothetical protein D3C79_876090 [compost metagenome]
MLFNDFLALAFLDGAADQFHRLGQVERLGQVFEGAALEGRDGAVQVGVGRHDDHRQAGLLGAHLLQQLQARAAGHADVADQHLGRLARGIAGIGVGQGIEHFARMGEAAGRQIFPGQRFLQDKADRGVVIYYPDRLHTFLLPSAFV